MTRPAESSGALRCSFCGKTQAQVRRLIAGPAAVFICEECVALCTEMVEEQRALDLAPEPSRLPTPHELAGFLDEHVVGQDAAKRALAVAVYNHYKRVGTRPEALPEAAPGTADDAADDADDAASSPARAEDEVEVAKSNVLLLGPTGCGKTHLVQTLARRLDVPFVVADATSLTAAGYVGEDVESMLTALLRAADGDVAKAQRGIVYIDEIDKITRRGDGGAAARDVSGEGVQQALLKILEGTVVSVPARGEKRAHAGSAATSGPADRVDLDTRDVLFVVAGAFAGLDDVVAQRAGRGSAGFGAELRSLRPEQDPLALLGPQDLVTFGLIPELVGRLPVVTRVQQLTEDDLVRVLTEPRHSLVRQYTRLLELDGVELRFTDEALRAVARWATERGTGARGLRAGLETVLQPWMFELPSQEDVTELVVEEHAVLDALHPGEPGAVARTA